MLVKDLKRVANWEVGGENVIFYDEKGIDIGFLPIDTIIGTWLSQGQYQEEARQRILSASKKMGKVV